MEQFYCFLLMITSYGNDIAAILHQSRFLTGNPHGGKLMHPFALIPGSQSTCEPISYLSSNSSQEIVDDDESRIDVGTFRVFAPHVSI